MTWINTKTAASRVGISPRTFREDWTPEEGPAQVTFRTNGKLGPGRRVEVLEEDLERVLADRIRRRAS